MPTRRSQRPARRTRISTVPGCFGPIGAAERALPGAASRTPCASVLARAPRYTVQPLALRTLPLLASRPALGRPVSVEEPYFACNGCGECCRRHRVAITHRDLARLVGALHVPAESLVAWLGAEAVDLDAESASMVELPRGPALMVLAHAAGGCALLTSEQRCSAHAARPQDCRVYPFVVERGRDGDGQRLSWFEGEPCGDLSDEATPVAEFERADQVRWAELTEYRAHVARWNRLARHRARLHHSARGEREFLAYLTGV